MATHIQSVGRDRQSHLYLPTDDYHRLFSMSLDSCSLQGPSVSRIPEVYRRFFAIPWALSRLILFLDYPEYIPQALPTEGRIADSFMTGRPEQLAILAAATVPSTGILRIALRIQDKSSFLAVTLLRHYFEIHLRQTADFWRQAQRVLPPLGVSLEFPRWRNKRIDAYELTVETTPIVRLLMGKAMYRDARHVWFREILQNALDANSARRALDGDSYSSTLEIALDGSRCTVRDNGIGMARQHILQYLTRLGRSIWNSEELTQGKNPSKESTLRAIGKFGIGFAAVFQDAERVTVRTRFFRDVGEVGWQVEFSAVDKPFLLEATTTAIGTEVEMELQQDKEKALSPDAFIKLVNAFFLYIDENIAITPDPSIPRSLAAVSMIRSDTASKSLLRDVITQEQIGSYRFKLRAVFAFGYKPKDKDDKLPGNFVLVSNSGVRVFQQSSLMLKPGKQYILMEESDKGTHYEDPREYGVKHFWIVVDFEKGASPILPSRLEIDIESEFSKEVLTLVQTRFIAALRSACREIGDRRQEAPKERRRALLAALMDSCEDYSRWSRRRSRPSGFCNVTSIQEAAVELYGQYADIAIQSDDGPERWIPITELQARGSGVYVTETVSKSPLFRVYAKAMGVREWVVVEGPREFFLFGKVMGSIDWIGYAIEKHLYTERKVFNEVSTSPLTPLLRGDYAVIGDQIFGKEAFVVLPSNLPGSWRRGEAAGLSRSAVVDSCPPRVLVNPNHPLIKAISDFAAESVSSDRDHRELKLLLDSLCDSVVENDRVTVARERWKSIQRDLKELAKGGIPELGFDHLVSRR